MDHLSPFILAFERERAQWIAREESLVASRGAAESRYRQLVEECEERYRQRGREDGEALELLRREGLSKELGAREEGVREGRREAEGVMARAREAWEAELERVSRSAREEVEEVRRGSSTAATLTSLASKLDELWSGAFSSAAEASEARSRALDARESGVVAGEARSLAAWERVKGMEAKVSSLLGAVEERVVAWRVEAEGEKGRLSAEGERLRCEGVRLAGLAAAGKEELKDAAAATASLRTVCDTLTAAIPTLQSEVGALRGERDALKVEVERAKGEVGALSDAARVAARDIAWAAKERVAIEEEGARVRELLRAALAAEAVAKAESERAVKEREEVQRLAFESGVLKEEREAVRTARAALARERDALGVFRGELMRMLHAAAAASASTPSSSSSSSFLGGRGGAPSGGLSSFSLPPHIASILSEGEGGAGATASPPPSLLPPPPSSSFHTLGIMHAVAHPHPNIALLQKQASATAATVLGQHKSLLASLGLPNGRQQTPANSAAALNNSI